jgi:hypothetical protein
LAAAKQVFLIGYGVLAVGVVAAYIMIELCIFCCLREKKGSKKEDETAIQLAQVYGH